MDKKNCGDYEVTCSSCGRPWAVCKEKGGCSKCGDVRFCEYGRKASGCIREKQPGCPMQAVIPSVTVDTVNGIKGLSDCLVHVADINTTYYIDDQHRLLTTWGGPVSVYDYDFDENPLNLRNQMAYDTANNILAIFDKSGVAYKVPISNLDNDYNVMVNKPQINGHELIGNKTSHELGLQGELTAGANIQINDNTISATDTTYTAGNGIELDDTEIKAKIGDGLEFGDNGEIEVKEPVPEGFFSDSQTVVSGEGNPVILHDTAKSILRDVALYGDMSQSGSPTPDNPESIKLVTGDQTISIGDGDHSSQTVVHLGNFEVCRIGNRKDYIFYNSPDSRFYNSLLRKNAWCIHREIGKYSFDGTEGALFTWDSSIPRVYLSSASLASLGISCIFPTNSGTVAEALSNKFKAKTFTQVYTNKQGGFAMSSSGKNWNFSKLGWTLKSQAMSDIAGTEVYYVLANPIEEEIGDNSVLLGLGELLNTMLYEGSTEIFVSGNLPFSLYAEAYKYNWDGIVDGILLDIDRKADVTLVERKPFYFNNVAEMKDYPLNNGDMAITAGYYDENDGGRAEYIITDETLTADESFVVSLNNGLFAKLLIRDNTVNIRQLGARSQAIDNTKYDIAPYIAKYIETVGTSTTTAAQPDKITLYIPSGVWYSSPLTITGLGYSIIGDEQFLHNRNRGTMISSLEDNQSYIFKFSDSVNFTLKNICFTTSDYYYSSARNVLISDDTRVKTIGQYCVRFEKMSFGDTDNLYFQRINGQAFEIASSWEIRFRKMFFRNIDAHNGCVMKFAKYIEGASGDGGVNASSFDNMMFEATLGHLMELESNCKLYNCYFGVINFEDNEISRSYVTPTEFTNDNIAAFEASNPVHYAVFYMGEDATNFATCTINSIQLNNLSTFFYTLDGVNYCYDNIFRLECDDSLFEVIVNDIDSLGIKKNAAILYSHGLVAYQSSFILNNISSVYHYDKEFIYDVENFTYIRNDGRIKAITSGVVPHLTNSATPAYMVTANRGSGRGNLLKSDGDAKNELGVCVNLSTYYSAFSFYKASEKLYLNAKIPNGQTAKLYLNSGTAQTENIVGTGSFKIYEISLDANNQIGDTIHVALANDNTADYCLVDYFIN